MLRGVRIIENKIVLARSLEERRSEEVKSSMSIYRASCLQELWGSRAVILPNTMNINTTTLSVTHFALMCILPQWNNCKWNRRKYRNMLLDIFRRWILTRKLKRKVKRRMVFFLVLQHCFIISKGRKVVVKAKKMSELYRLALQLQTPILGSLFIISNIKNWGSLTILCICVAFALGGKEV